MPYDYIKDPAAIYAESFRQVAAETDLSGFDPADHVLIRRIVHACGMPDIVADVRCTQGVLDVVKHALSQPVTIFADCQMVAGGIMMSRLPAHATLRQTLTDPATPHLAKALGTTRSAAAVELWREGLDGAVVVIGNAPTALFHVLEIMETTEIRPAAILACPVGFVGAAESKQALVSQAHHVPYLTVMGRRGGSAMAAAALNAALLSLDAS